MAISHGSGPLRLSKESNACYRIEDRERAASCLRAKACDDAFRQRSRTSLWKGFTSPENNDCRTNVNEKLDLRLPDYILGLLVFTQCNEAAMPQVIVARPLEEFELSDENRF
jgi:hypothetical protein